MTSLPDMNPPTAVPSAAAIKAKVRAKAIVRRPYELHVRITPAMNDAIERWTGPKSHKCQADIVCDALDFYFKQFDPMYRQEVTGRSNA
jgi:hypothetical protein